jgi:hypothetical protein
MKRRLAGFLCLILACAAAVIAPRAVSFAQSSGSQAPQEIYWYGDYKQALKVAKETGKPLFLEFRCEA